jgi:hypothetical protein
VIDIPALFRLDLPIRRVVSRAADGDDRGLLAVAGISLALVALGGGVVAAGAGRSLRGAT